jgi:uroporphyrinogen decarboxylase
MAGMTSAEREMTVAMGGEPDRVPVSIMGLPWALEQLYGRNSFVDCVRDPEKLAKAAAWNCEEAGSDDVGVFTDTQLTWEAIAEASGLTYPATLWEDFEPAHPHRLYEGDPLKTVAFGDPLVKTLKDAEKLVPADPYKHGRLPVVLKAIELTKEKLNGKWAVGGVYDVPTCPVASLMGWTQMFIAMEKDLELFKKVEEVVIKTSYEFAKAQLKAGATMLATVCHFPQWVGSEMFLSKPVWVHVDHPPELCERLFKEFGVPTALHPCSVGCSLPGIRAFKMWLDHTPAFNMPEGGGADALAEAKEQLAPAVMIGNIPPVDIMMHGSPSDVEEACVELIQKCAPGGRYILGTGCEIPIGTPPENVQAMVNSARKYGKYPIKL